MVHRSQTRTGAPPFRIAVLWVVALSGVALGTGPAVAQDVWTAADFDELCSHCGSVEPAGPRSVLERGDGCLTNAGEEEEDGASLRVAHAREIACALAEPLRSGRADRERTLRRHELLWAAHQLRGDVDVMVRLARDGQEGLHLFVGPEVETTAGHWYLDLGAEQTFALTLDSATEERLEAGLEAGTLEARIRFALRSRRSADVAICEARGDRTRIAADLLGVDLLLEGEEGVLAGAETALQRAERMQRETLQATGRSLSSPMAWVSGVEVESEGACTRRDVELVHLALERLANACYLRALRGQGSLQGALVLRFVLQEEGGVGTPRVLIDALHSEVLRGCMVHGLDEMMLERLPASSEVSLRATLLFQLGPPEAEAPEGETP